MSKSRQHRFKIQIDLYWIQLSAGCRRRKDSMIERARKARVKQSERLRNDADDLEREETEGDCLSFWWKGADRFLLL